MKYFTERLWRDINSPNSKIAAKASRTWDRNVKAYEAQLEVLLPAMSRRNRCFWSDYVHRLHDGAMARVIVGDAAMADALEKWPKSSRTDVMIEVTDWDGFLYTLKYKSIEAIDMRLRRGEDRLEGTLFEDWGYSELTAEDGGLLRHSILFSTFSEISIVFGGFSYTRARLAKT